MIGALSVLLKANFYQAPTRENLEILDRVGGGDSFASGLIYGFLAGKGPQWAVDCGAAHGALAMTTPGDTTMATLSEVEKVMKGGTARVDGDLECAGRAKRRRRFGWPSYLLSSCELLDMSES